MGGGGGAGLDGIGLLLTGCRCQFGPVQREQKRQDSLECLSRSPIRTVSPRKVLRRSITHGAGPLSMLSAWVFG